MSEQIIAVLQQKAAACDKTYVELYGASASPIPWQQIITEILALFTNCPLGGSAELAAREMNHPGPIGHAAMRRIVHKHPETRGIQGNVVSVLVRVGATVTPVEAGQMLGM
jgi:hypothetical protein